MPLYVSLLAYALLISLGGVSQAEGEDPVYIGFDGEYGLLNSTSAQSIERGIRVAMDEINGAGGVLSGRPLELLTKDNRSVPARGRENIRQFVQIKDLVAVIGGRFSPVILDVLPLVHREGIVLLDAWGAADGITDHGYNPSYSFRLSLKDQFAIPVMLQHAVDKGISQVGVLLPNTGWGRSNAKAINRYQATNSELKILEPVWYNWGEKVMLRHYMRLVDAGAEAVILVANDMEGSLLVSQLATLGEGEPVPIVSHWGVTGGRMVEKSGEMLHKLDFSVVQTFSFFKADPGMRDRVMSVTQRLYGIDEYEKIESPVGFGHAYDLIHILARAIELAGSTDRGAIRDALEQVKQYQGLTGYYAAPFTPERHDALRQEQVFMARYRRDGVIEPINGNVVKSD
ncbi:MAG: ABC transporter substrate-binding protein [Pseudomonadota bacterium]